MSEHYEILGVIKDSDESFDTLNWTSKLLSLKVKSDKWKHFPSFAGSITLDLLHMDRLKNFKIFSDDVLLCGYIRSGTSMMQEMIWLIMNDFDFTTAKSVFRGKRFPCFE